MQQKGKTKDGTPQLNFHFEVDENGKHRHIYVLELWTHYPLSFMVTYDGGWTNFHWDGEKWEYEMKDQKLAALVVDNLVLGYESKLQNQSPL